MRDAAVDGAEVGQQAGPGVVAALQHLLARGRRLRAAGRAGWRRRSSRRRAGRRGGAGRALRRRRGRPAASSRSARPRRCRSRGRREQGAAAVLGRRGRAPDEHLDGAAHLVAELVGDLLLVLRRSGEQGLEGLLGGRVKKAPAPRRSRKARRVRGSSNQSSAYKIGKAGGLAGLA